MVDPIEIIEKRTRPHDGETWFATVRINGHLYSVALERGKSVRIAYKPKGENRGFHWNGSVRDRETGRSLFNERVTKSTGLRWLCEAAGLVKLRPSELRKRLRSFEFQLDLVNDRIKHDGDNRYAIDTPMRRSQRIDAWIREREAIQREIDNVRSDLGIVP